MTSKIQDMLNVQRQNQETSRAGLKWDSDDDDQLTSMVKQNVPIPEIAKSLLRTPGSIKTRLIVRAIGKMNVENVSKSDAAAMVGIEESDITEYMDKKKERDSRYIGLNNKPRSTRVVTTNDVYDLLQAMNKKLDSLCSK